MKKSEWSDKQLEDLLRQMPKIKDDRNPRDIYQNISLNKKRKRGSWFLPGAAAAAALLLLAILVPKLMFGSETSFDRTMEEKSSIEQNMTTAEENTALSMDKQEAELRDEGTIEGQSRILMKGRQKNALYDDDDEIGNGKVFTYWIPDQNAQILVPISTIVEPGNENNDWFDLFTQGLKNLKEEEWGLMDYYPLNASLVYQREENRVHVDVPANHTYGQGAANEQMFIGALTNNIASNSDVKEILLSTNGNSGIEFGHIGPTPKLDVKLEKKHAYFFFTPVDKETPLIVPSWESYNDIQAALEAMKTNQSQFGLTASVNASLPYKSIVVDNSKLLISFDENTKMNDDAATLYSLEAILLAAKDFDLESVVLINAPIKQLGPFDLTQEIKVPLGANFRPIE